MLIAIIILLLIIIFLLLYCNCRRKGKPCCEQPPQKGYCAAAINDGYTPGEESGFVAYTTALSMHLDYKNDDGKKYVWDNSRKMNIEDATSVWFDLPKLKRLIGYIENSMCTNGCKDSTRLGIRFYYAKYPDADRMASLEDLKMLPANYAHRHTLFLVPTYWDPSAGADVDFDPMQVKKGCIFKNHIDSVKGRVWMALPVPDGSGTDATNHGSMIPPDLDKGTSF